MEVHISNIKLVAYGVDTLILNVRYSDSKGQPVKQDLDDGLPDGWLRYVLPSEDDTNRSRWLVHPAWVVVQAAFTEDIRCNKKL